MDVRLLSRLDQRPNFLAAPTQMQATTRLDGFSIDLTWQDNSAHEAGYQIWRSLLPYSGYTLVGLAAANAESYQDTGLEPLTHYYYNWRAYRGSRVGPFGFIANDEPAREDIAHGWANGLVYESLRYQLLQMEDLDSARDAQAIQNWWFNRRREPPSAITIPVPSNPGIGFAAIGSTFEVA